MKRDLRNGITITGLSLACLFGAIHSAGCGASPTQVGTDVTIGVNAGICALSRYAQDIANGMSEVASVADAAVTCGLSLIETQGLLDAARKSEVQTTSSLK